MLRLLMLRLLHCRSSAAVRQQGLRSSRGPRRTLRIQPGGTGNCHSPPSALPLWQGFGYFPLRASRPDHTNVPYWCQQSAGDLRFCHSRRRFGLQAGQLHGKHLPASSPFARGTGQAGAARCSLLASLRDLRPPPKASEAFIFLASY